MQRCTYLTLAGLFIWMSVCGCARSNNPTQFWGREIQQESLEEVTKRLADPMIPAWPTTPSTYAIQKLPASQKDGATQNAQLVEAMRKKMADGFKPDVEQTQDQLEADVEMYSRIAKALDRSGGYCNLLLADTALRLAVYRVSGWLVLHPDDTKESERLVSMVDAPAVNVKELLEQLSDQDADLEQRMSDLPKIKSADNLYQAYSAIGIGPEFVFQLPADETSKLLVKPSVIQLVFRMAMTESLVKSNLAGSLRFFQLGGRYAELDPRDIRPFTKRMESEAKKYSYPLLQRRTFTENEVLYLITIHKDAGVRTAYLNTALR